MQEVTANHRDAPLLIGIDAGTTSMKVALFSSEGALLASSSIEYRVDCPTPDAAEVDAETYWAACCQGIRKVLKASQVDPYRIIGVSVSAQGETIVPLGKDGKPLRPAIVWLDNRPKLQAERIRERFGAERVFAITGQPDIVPTWPLCKIMWIRDNEPWVFEKTWKFVTVEDFIIFRLTGQIVGSFAMYTSSLFVDIRSRAIWDEVLDSERIERSMIPELKDSGISVASVSYEASQATGLSTTTVVCTGAMDQIAGAIGSGNVAPGMVTVSTGAALAILATVEKPVMAQGSGIPCHCHGLPGVYCLFAWAQTAGLALKWFRDTFFSAEHCALSQADMNTYAYMDALAEKVPPGAEDLVMIPHLAGAQSPEFNPRAKGVFFGVTLRHRRGHFVRSLMEAVSAVLKKNLDIMEQLNISVTEIRSIGGGSRSRLWTQIYADMTGKAVVTLQQSETACLGAAILAGVGTGVFPDVATACDQMVHIKEVVTPNESNSGVYERLYKQFNRLYEASVPLF